jgi:hypothetical protein
VPSFQRRFASDEAVSSQRTGESLEESEATPEQLSEDLVVEPATEAEAKVVAEEAAAVSQPTDKVESVEQNAFGTPHRSDCRCEVTHTYRSQL